MSLVELDDKLPGVLEPYLPQWQSHNRHSTNNKKPFVTLTYAQSLDSCISKGPGQRTVISHPQTKTMTHYLRYHHDAILVGTTTAMCDDPGLNCKWNNENFEKSPIPIIIDMNRKWNYSKSKLCQLYRSGQGKKPIIVTKLSPAAEELNQNEANFLVLQDTDEFSWDILLKKLKLIHGINSVMVEGGANVINQLLDSKLQIVDSLIITIGSKFLGSNGVKVTPSQELELHQVSWWTGISDSVLCGKLQKKTS